MKKLILLFAILAQTTWGQVSPTIQWNAPVLTISGVDYQVDSDTSSGSLWNQLEELYGVDNRLFSERYAGSYIHYSRRSVPMGEAPRAWRPYTQPNNSRVLYSFSADEEYFYYGSETNVNSCRTRNTQIRSDIWSIVRHTRDTLHLQSYVNDDPIQGIENETYWYVENDTLKRTWIFNDGFRFEKTHIPFTENFNICTETQDEILDLTARASGLIRQTSLIDYNDLNAELDRIDGSTMYALSEDGYSMLNRDLNALIVRATDAVSRNATDTLTLGTNPYVFVGNDVYVNLTAVIDDGVESCYPRIHYSFDGEPFVGTTAWTDGGGGLGCNILQDNNHNQTHWSIDSQLIVSPRNQNWSTLILQYTDRSGNVVSVTTERLNYVSELLRNGFSENIIRETTSYVYDSDNRYRVYYSRPHENIFDRDILYLYLDEDMDGSADTGASDVAQVYDVQILIERLTRHQSILNSITFTLGVLNNVFSSNGYEIRAVLPHADNSSFYSFQIYRPDGTLLHDHSDLGGSSGVTRALKRGQHWLIRYLADN